jgi:hypothetical protein
MLTFSNYLVESKNLHLEHLEDALFNEGSRGVEDALRFCESLVEMLNGSTKSRTNVTVKWDGAPAVFAGINPDSGKFFVGTKSVFNAKTPKINYTNADIDKNHGNAPGLVDKLKVALKHFKKLGITGVLQGDLLFTDDIEEKTINGEDYLVFTPNTITYAVPIDSDMAKQVKKAKIGVVWHTTYTGKTMVGMRASFGANVGGLTKNKDVFFTDADFRDTSGTATFTAAETESASDAIANVKRSFNGTRRFIDDFTSRTSIIDELKIYANSQVRQGSVGLSAAEFTNFVNDKMRKGVDSLKTPAGRQRKEKAMKEVIGYLSKNKSKIQKVFDLHKSLIDLKLMFVRKLERVKSLGMFIRTEDGYRVTAPEGFVAIDKLKGNAYKLVDRLEFSRANFTVAKNWRK